jgi:hypothetical protein
MLQFLKSGAIGNHERIVVQTVLDVFATSTVEELPSHSSTDR